jgi:DnaJ-class molecular chaperone
MGIINVKCPACGGAGAYLVAITRDVRRPKVCAVCKGKGKVTRAKFKRAIAFMGGVGIKRAARFN